MSNPRRMGGLCLTSRQSLTLGVGVVIIIRLKLLLVYAIAPFLDEVSRDPLLVVDLTEWLADM